jgi:hypothetical protein
VTTSGLLIIVAGLMAQHPTMPGVTWANLQYMMGLARLGHQVYYIEDSGEWPYNLDGSDDPESWIAMDCGANLYHLQGVLKRYGFGDHWAYRFPRTGEWFGLPEVQRNAIIKNADLVLNVSGMLERPDDYRAVNRLVYIDTDPIFTQVKILSDEQFSARVSAHDVHFSFGERHSEFVPSTKLHWLSTRQPIMLSEWHPRPGRADTFTTIMSLASYAPVSYQGHLFGQKDLQLRRYLKLPIRVRPAVLEIALGQLQHLEWQSDDNGFGLRTGASTNKKRSAVEALTEAGFRLIGANSVCPDLDGYRDYVETSAGEWSVAKHGYVAGQPGWFSDRSACYLAAGKPVVLENCGFDAVLPTGEGLLAFRDLDDAAAAIEAVRADYPRHSAAARDIAVSCFNSDKVLDRLLALAMAPRIANPARGEHGAAPDNP